MGAADAILIHTIIQVTAAKVAEWRKEQTKQVTIMDNVAKIAQVRKQSIVKTVSESSVR
jgi:hypothetical protein